MKNKSHVLLRIIVIAAMLVLVVAAAIIGVCLLTKPSYKNVGTLDAEKLFALRTPYVDNNSAVGAILDALGFRELGSSGADYGYAVHLSTDREPMGITVLYTYEGAVPRKSEERYRQIAMRGYIALALIDNAEWFSWQEHGADGTSNKADSTASDSLYPIVYLGYPDATRESAEGLQAYINMLQEWMKDDAVPYVYGESEQDRWAWNADFPDASDEITPWPTLTENDPCSVRAEDYGIAYDAEKLPDWDTCALSYLCAYYLNADGAYAEGAMDVLAQRYQQAPNTVKAYLRRLAGQQAPDGRGDAAEVLLADISRYAMSQLTGGLPVAASYERDQLSISVSEVYSVTYRTVTYDENYSEDIPVYEVGSGAQLSVIKGEGFTLYGRYNEENVALHNGDVVELTEQFVGLGMDGQYAVRFQYRSAAETAEKTTLSFNDNGAGMVSYPAYVFRGSGYAITVLGNAWHQMTLSSGWTDICVDGSPAINGKPAEVWQSTEDINTQLAVVHLGAMTLKEAQEWSKGAAGDGFTLTESKQGDMSGDGKNGSTEMYWTCGFYGTGSDRLAVIKTYPVAQTEHLGYALNAMADTFTLT